MSSDHLKWSYGSLLPSHLKQWPGLVSPKFKLCCLHLRQKNKKQTFVHTKTVWFIRSRQEGENTWLHCSSGLVHFTLALYERSKPFLWCFKYVDSCSRKTNVKQLIISVVEVETGRKGGISNGNIPGGITVGSLGLFLRIIMNYQSTQSYTNTANRSLNCIWLTDWSSRNPCIHVLMCYWSHQMIYINIYSTWPL